MKICSLFSAGFLFICLAGASQGSTTQTYDPINQTFTFSSSARSSWENNHDFVRELGSFNGSFLIQFSGLSAVWDPAKYPLFLTIPVTLSVTGGYPQLAGGTVSMPAYAYTYTGPPYGSVTFNPSWDLDTTSFTWAVNLTSSMYAQAHQPTDMQDWVDTETEGSIVLDFGQLTLHDPFGNNLLTQGVTFQVTPLVPEPSTWTLGLMGLAVFAFGAKRFVGH